MDGQPSTPDRFSETQRLGQNPVVRVLVIAEPVFLGLMFLALGLSVARSAWQTLLLTWLGVAVVMPLLIARLTMRTRVTGDELIVSWSPIYTRRVRLSEIVEAEPIRYNAISQAGGWGIKFTKRMGLVLNVYGDRGVQIATERKRLMVGSQRADELAAAILQGAIESCDK